MKDKPGTYSIKIDFKKIQISKTSEVLMLIENDYLKRDHFSSFESNIYWKNYKRKR